MLFNSKTICLIKGIECLTSLFQMFSWCLLRKCFDELTPHLHWQYVVILVTYPWCRWRVNSSYFFLLLSLIRWHRYLHRYVFRNLVFPQYFWWNLGKNTALNVYACTCPCKCPCPCTCVLLMLYKSIIYTWVNVCFHFQFIKMIYKL